jgi:tetratricopeptide (TPR) repeat protein
MEPAGEASVRGDFAAAAFTHAGVTSRFLRQGDRFVVRTDGPDGALADYEVAYTFGLEPLQQLLLPRGGGRLQALSIAWDTRPRAEGGQRWFHLYPDARIDASDPLHWTRPAHNWNHACADCHTTGYRKRFDAGADRFDSAWAELGVGCEACHGPGSAHVASAADGAALPLPARLDERRGIRWEIDPASGNAVRSAQRASEREIEACAPCHARRSSLGDSYQAGERLLDHYRPALLERPLYWADGQQRDEVYVWASFLQSRMYAAGVTCSDCHEPHSGAVRAEGNGLCATCHAPQKYDDPAHHHHAAGSAGADCTACHMPTATYMVVDPRRDHSFRVPRPDRSAALGTPNACNGCHAQETPGWAAERLRAWLGRDARGHQGFAEALAAADADAAAAGAALRAVAADASTPAIARATALASLDAQASRASYQALVRALSDASPLVRLGALQGLASVPPEPRAGAAAPLVADPLRAVRFEAVRAVAGASARLPPGQRAAFERTSLELVEALRLDADRAEGRTALGTFLAARGDLDGALRELRAAVAIEPAFVAGVANLADVHRARGEEGEAERVLRAGLERSPESAPLHHALGLALVRAGRSKEALAELEQATALEPATTRFGYVHAVALHSAGREEEAIARLERILARHPRDAAVLEALSAIQRERGDANAAARYEERLRALATED